MGWTLGRLTSGSRSREVVEFAREGITVQEIGPCSFDLTTNIEENLCLRIRSSPQPPPSSGHPSFPSHFCPAVEIDLLQPSLDLT